MNITLKFIIISLIVISYLLMVATPVLAAGLLPEPTGSSGNYSICDVIQVFVNVAQWILGMVGGLALLMFVWGGFGLMMSGGSSEAVQKNRKILTSALLGLIIVLGAWLLINMMIGIFTGSLGTEPSKIFTQSWTEIKCK